MAGHLVNTSFENMFKLRRPCANCPLLKVGAIDLRPGRLAGIIKNLVADDHSTFYCHETVTRADGHHWTAADMSPPGRKACAPAR